MFEKVEDLRSQNVTADDRILRGRVRGFGLFHQARNVEQPWLARDRLSVKDSVGGNRRPFDHLGGHDRRLHVLEGIHHLLQARGGCINHVVGQDDGEWFIAHKVARHQHGVPQPHRFLLADVGEPHHVRNLAAEGQKVGLPALLQRALQFVAHVEMVFDGRFAAAGDNHDLVAARGQRLLDTVLDDRLIDQREHFLGNGFRGRQKAGAESRGRKNRLAYSAV